MEVVEEWEGEEESGGLKVRSMKGKMENPEAEKGAVQVEELGDSESCVYLDKDRGEFQLPTVISATPVSFFFLFYVK